MCVVVVDGTWTSGGCWCREENKQPLEESPPLTKPAPRITKIAFLPAPDSTVVPR